MARKHAARWLRVLVAVALLWPATAPRAAMLEGVVLADAQSDDGTPLRLNGVALRTASVFHVKVYVAGLYLEHPSQDGDAIIHSPGKKLLVIQFLRNITAEDGRTAWLEGFEGNCRPPCHLIQRNVERFLAAVPPVSAGDVARLLFSDGHLRVSINGRLIGTVDDPGFARVILATFIGRAPPTEALKRGLLGMAKQ